MNWVWANSPTSGNERLVLLALADACSREDGTGCWPSARTLARKANISDRTVRRVIARLETDGQILVHRGGGRAGASNSYTVLMGIHSPCQSVTPDSLTGGDTADGPPLTQPCPATPDAAVSPDLPGNRHGTTTGGGIARGAPSRVAEPGDAGQFFAALSDLSPAWRLSPGQRRRLVPAVAAAVAAGWTPARLAEHAGVNAAGVRSPYAVLAARLAPGELPDLLCAAARPARPVWCGQCNESTRRMERPSDGADAGPCPRCSPRCVDRQAPG
jgi:hypothetical protein